VPDAEQPQAGHVERRLLPDLAPDRVVRVLVLLQRAAREVPSAGHDAQSALQDQDLVAPADDGVDVDVEPW
jgi:hypothetical protein